jgi:hypothetical protein
MGECAADCTMPRYACGLRTNEGWYLWDKIEATHASVASEKKAALDLQSRGSTQGSRVIRPRIRERRAS